MREKRRAESAAGSVDLGPLPGLVGYALRRAQIAVFQDFYACFAPLGLRPAEFSVLLVVRCNPGLRQGQVAEALGIKPPNFAVLLGRLVSRGLVERRESPTSRRAVALHLAPSGDAVLDQAMLLQQQHEQRVTDHLGEANRNQLLRLLRALA